MAANSSGKPAAQTVPPADLTKDIDDEWADDDEETGGVPTVTASKSPSAEPADASAKSEGTTSASARPGGKRTISGTLPTQRALQHDSEAPATDEIDSDWPDEDQALAAPQIPKQSKVPDLAVADVNRPLAAAPEASSSAAKAPSTHPPTSASFEKAAERLVKESALSGASWQSEPPSQAAAESSTEPAKAETSDAKHEHASGATALDKKAPRTGSDEKKGSPVLGLAAAAAAVALIGLAVHSARSAKSDATAVAEHPATTKAVVRPAKEPEPAKPEPQPEPAKPAPATDDSKQAAAEAPSGSASEDSASEDSASEDKAESAEKVLVHLAVTPSDAPIYYKGQPLGTGLVGVEVAPGEKKLLLVVKDGYWPRKVVLDGSHKYVNVGLREKPAEPGESAPTAQPKAMYRPPQTKPPPSKPPSVTRPPVPHRSGSAASQGALPPAGR